MDVRACVPRATGTRRRRHCLSVHPSTPPRIAAVTLGVAFAVAARSTESNQGSGAGGSGSGVGGMDAGGAGDGGSNTGGAGNAASGGAPGSGAPGGGASGGGASGGAGGTAGFAGSSGGAGGLGASGGAGAAGVTACSSGSAEPGDVTVSLASLEQKISGFGVSSAWAGDFRDPDRDPDVLWSTTTGAGLSLHRIRIGAGDTSEIRIAQKAVEYAVKVWATPWEVDDSFTDRPMCPTNDPCEPAPKLIDPAGWASRLVEFV